MNKPLSWKILLILGPICLILSYLLKNIILVAFIFSVIGLIATISGIVEVFKIFIHKQTENGGRNFLFFIKNNLIKIFLVRRPETENKWWHRLFNVLLFGSGVIVFILTILLNIGTNNESWISYEPIAFSLEPKYDQSTGKIIPCETTMDSTYLGKPVFVMQCKGVTLSYQEAKRYEDLFSSEQTRLLKKYGLDKYNQDISWIESDADERISWLKKSINDRKNDPAYPEYIKALDNLAKVKVSASINFGNIGNDILYWLIIPIITLISWIIFWSSIIYRSILYIVFGKKNK